MEIKEHGLNSIQYYKSPLGEFLDMEMDIVEVQKRGSK
jgi:hypothetical protein